jgi:predicted Zn-dependent protease
MKSYCSRLEVLRPLLVALCLLAACATRQPGAPIQPGFNVYSVEQDIELGRQAAAEIRQQVDIVSNQQLQNYLGQLGQRLASQPEAGRYPYSFTLVNEEGINAFALPGGPVFVHAELLQAADDEAQLAGVLAHEISHVALRHATNQASKANLIQIPAVLAGSVIGEGSVLAQLGQLGLGLGVNSVLLKYSRDAETEADALGARIMAGAGYDPMEMARFFQKLEQEGGARAPQFLSSHPNPGNRMQAVQAEIQTFPQRQYSAGNTQFPRMKQLASQLPEPDRSRVAASNAPSTAPAPSAQVRQFRSRTVSLQYPANWQAFGDGTSAVVALAPQEGLVRNQRGGISLGFGTVMSYYRPASGRLELAASTQELIRDLASVNPNLRVAGPSREVAVDGSPGLLTTLSGLSPYGGEETNVLLTVPRPQGLFYMVFVTPSSRFEQFQGSFQQMLQSLQFST